MRGDLAIDPKIGAYFPGRELPAASVVDKHCQWASTLGRLGHVLAGFDGPINGPRMAANHLGDGLTLVLDGQNNGSHTNKTNTFRKCRKGKPNEYRKVAEMQIFTETVGVRTWNRDLFVKLVKAKKASGVPSEEIAQALDMSPATLQGFLDQRDRPPSKRLLELGPPYLQVELDDLWVEDADADAEELRHAWTFMRDCLGQDIAATKTDSDALRYYRLAMTVITTTQA